MPSRSAALPPPQPGYRDRPVARADTTDTGLDGQTTDDFTALGVGSEREPSGGSGTTAIGVGAGYGETGGNNTFVGQDAGSSTESGQNNVAVGTGAGTTDDGIDDTVSIGYFSYVKGNRGVAIGYGAHAKANGVAIGDQTSAEVNEIALGNVFSTLFVHQFHTDTPVVGDPGTGGVVQIGVVSGGNLTISVDGVLYTIAVTPV